MHDKLVAACMVTGTHMYLEPVTRSGWEEKRPVPTTMMIALQAGAPCPCVHSTAHLTGPGRPGLEAAGAGAPGRLDPEKFICTCLEAFGHSIPIPIRAHVLWVPGQAS